MCRVSIVDEAMLHDELLKTVALLRSFFSHLLPGPGISIDLAESICLIFKMVIGNVSASFVLNIKTTC